MPHKTITDPVTGQVLHYGMSLEDYTPYKALPKYPVLYGPFPPNITHCSCGYLHYKCDCYENCECIIDLHEEEREMVYDNPDLFKIKQTEMERWEKIRMHMYNIYSTIVDSWKYDADPISERFYSLMDRISPIRCYTCDIECRDYCWCV